MTPPRTPRADVTPSARLPEGARRAAAAGQAEGAELVYGAAVLDSRGGGVLILVAFVPGVLAWISGSMFFAARQHEAYYDLTVPEKIQANLTSLAGVSQSVQQRVARLESERSRIWTTPARRVLIDRAIAEEQRLSGLLPALRPALEDPRTYGGDEP